MNNDERFAKIMNAVDVLRDEGVTVTTKTWGIHWDFCKALWEPQGCCCPLGALLVVYPIVPEAGDNRRTMTAVRLLETKLSWLSGFIRVFDQVEGRKEKDHAYREGEKVARRVRIALATRGVL